MIYCKVDVLDLLKCSAISVWITFSPYSLSTYWHGVIKLIKDKQIEKSRIHDGLTWKQKLVFSFPLETGGSWRKSPHMISWMPPNGSVDLLTDLQEHGDKMRYWRLM